MKQGQSYFIPPMALSEKTFSYLVMGLSKLGRIVKLSDAIKKINAGTLKGKNFAITFDDGYLDNFTIASKILLHKGLPATFFIPVHQIDNNSIFWWDYIYSLAQRDETRLFEFLIENHCMEGDLRKSGKNAVQVFARKIVQSFNSMNENTRQEVINKLENEFGRYEGNPLLMGWNEIRNLDEKGFEIGSHTISHIPLTDLSEDQASFEIRQSKIILSKKINSNIEGFCYPRGAFSDSHIKMVQDSGYSYAVTTKFGSNKEPSDIYELCRRNISDYPDIRNSMAPGFHLLELSGVMDSLLSVRRIA